jgi:hypothetical protein
VLWILHGEIISVIAKYYSGDQIKNEMGRACGMYGGEERCIQGIGGVGDVRERGHLEDTGVDVRIILRWIFMK